MKQKLYCVQVTYKRCSKPITGDDVRSNYIPTSVIVTNEVKQSVIAALFIQGRVVDHWNNNAGMIEEFVYTKSNKETIPLLANKFCRPSNEIIHTIGFWDATLFEETS